MPARATYTTYSMKLEAPSNAQFKREITERIPYGSRTFNDYQRTWTFYRPHIELAREIAFTHYPELTEIDYERYRDAEEQKRKFPEHANNRATYTADFGFRPPKDAPGGVKFTWTVPPDFDMNESAERLREKMHKQNEQNRERAGGGFRGFDSDFDGRDDCGMYPGETESEWYERMQRFITLRGRTVFDQLASMTEIRRFQRLDDEATRKRQTGPTGSRGFNYRYGGARFGDIFDARPRYPGNYDVLGIGIDADKATATAAYRALAKKFHPDTSTEPNAAEQMTKINAAWTAIRKERKW